MAATYQVICHFLKSVGKVQPKGLVTPVALDTDTGLFFLIRQVLVVPVKTKYRAGHKSERGVQGEAQERKTAWCSITAQKLKTRQDVFICDNQ